MIGQALGHYRIIEKIGAGGMGEVYRARDERLERDVAIKVLPTGTLADEAARKRFRKEALALARLNHPNIATVYDFDTQDGVDFLATEYIPGVTLSDKLASGPLAEKEVVRLGGQLAEGLAAAHEQQVVHRDLKPGNLRVTPDARLKILDFGLAKLLLPTGDPGRTRSISETQGISGTLPYMAPEQLSGESPEARSDIYAAGNVLYEMATAQRPFREELLSRLTDAILHQPPLPPRALNSRVSPELERIILKCLEKDPENRYQSARELAVDLRNAGTRTAAAIAQPVVPPKAPWRRLGLGAGIAVVLSAGILLVLSTSSLRERVLGRGAPSRIESLAVLPLENLSRDPEQEYFADGMTDELTTNLAQIGGLRVISRTSVTQYKGTKKMLPQIARELNVDAVIEGSVLRSGNRVRITAQLVRAPTDTHLWASSYERDLRDVLALQDEVARTIAREIRVRLTPEEQMRLARARAIRPDAYEAYLRGIQYFSQGSLDKGKEFFERAIQLDPDYAPAYTGLASYYYLLGLFGVLRPNEAFPRAKEAAVKALGKDDALASAHDALALVKLQYEWNWAESEKEFRRAIELSPNNADIHHDYAHYLMSMDRTAEAVSESQRAVELDPFDAGLIACLGWHTLYARQYDQAIDHSLKAIRMEPDYFWAHLILGWAYEQKSMFEQAIAEFRKAIALTEGFPVANASIGHAFAVAGKRSEALEVIEHLAKQAKRSYVSAYDMAAIYVGLGDKARAFAWLQKAYAEHSSLLVHIKWDPRFDPLRSDPRFQDLLRRVGLPP